MTTVDPNIQRLADYCYGVDRNLTFDEEIGANKLDPKEMASEAGMAAAWVIAPPLLWKGVKTPALGMWKYINEPRLSYSQALDKVRLENKVAADAKRFLSYDANGNKYSLFDRYKNRALFGHIEAIDSKLPALNEKMSTPTTARGKAWNWVKEYSTYNKAKATKIANNNLINQQKEVKELRQLIKDAKSGKIPAKDLKAHYKKILAKLRSVDIKINELKMSPNGLKATTKLGRAGQFLKQKTGVYKLKSTMLKSSKGFKFLKAAGKIGKGAAVLAAVGAVLSEAGEVMGAAEIDKIEKAQGINNHRTAKQVGKSAVVAAGTIAGSWAAASAAGAAVGTAVCPVIGTAIGFVAGAIGGLLGGWLAKKVTGPSEVEKYQKEQQDALKEQQEAAKKQADETAKLATNDDGTKDELLAALLEAKDGGQIDDKEIIDLLDQEVSAREQEIAEQQVAEQERMQTYDQLTNLGNINCIA